MTWTRHRPKALSWLLLVLLLVLVGQSIWHYLQTGLLAPDQLGVVLRIVMPFVFVLLYLKLGGSTRADGDGLHVHTGVRRLYLPKDVIERIDQEQRRGGAVAIVKDGRRIELPGVPADGIRQVEKAMRA